MNLGNFRILGFVRPPRLFPSHFGPHTRTRCAPLIYGLSKMSDANLKDKFLEYTAKLSKENKRSKFVGEQFSQDYAKYRRKCHPDFVKEIIYYVNEKLPGKLSRAVDVGCGTGQMTTMLAPYFDEVYGIDVSHTQIAEALKNPENSPNINYSVGSAEELPFKDHSVDLVTAVACFHWFDRGIFMKEMKRILAPNGVLAVCSAGGDQFASDDPEKQKKLKQCTIDFWIEVVKADRQLVHDLLEKEKTAEVPTLTLTELKDNQTIELPVKFTAKLSDIATKFTTVSFFHEAFKDDKEGGESAIRELTQSYMKAAQTTDPDHLLDLEITNFSCLGRA